MIQVQLEFTGESRRYLARLEREMPITFRAAHAKAAIHARNRLRKVVREFGGSYRVSKLAPRHEMTGLIAPWRKPFGRLAEENSIVSFRRGDGQVIGWVDSLSEWASGVQGASRYEFTSRQKSYLHRRHHRLNGYHIPAYYDRPARLVIAPFTEHLQRAFHNLVLEEFNKKVASRLKKGQVIA